jgi:hypothetical protein
MNGKRGDDVIGKLPITLCYRQRDLGRLVSARSRQDIAFPPAGLSSAPGATQTGDSQAVQAAE